MSSVFGLVGIPSQSAYNAAKFAVRGFTYALREDLLGRPIRITTVEKDGVILFRGFPVESVETFEGVARAYSDTMLDYYERSTPRQVVSGKVYSSTEYPADQEIPLHNENSYQKEWPRKIFFLCRQAPGTGGNGALLPSLQAEPALARVAPGPTRDWIRAEPDLPAAYRLAAAIYAAMGATDLVADMEHEAEAAERRLRKGRAERLAA